MYVGYCVTAWAKIEEELFGILHDILGCSLERAAIVYYRQPTVSVRLGLVDEVSRTALPKRERESGGHDHEDLREWTRIRGSITELLETRSRIAHHPVNHGVALRDRKTGEVKPIPWRSTIKLDDFEFYNSYAIYMSEAERLRGRKSQQKRLVTDDLSRHAVSVQKIADELKIFRTRTLRRHLQEAARQESNRRRGQPPPVRVTIGGPQPRKRQPE